MQFKNTLEKAKLYVKSLLMRVEKDADKLILVPILVYIIFFSAYTCYMHYTFRTYAWDLGIITQSLWTTLNSDKILYSTLEVPYGNPTGNFLGVHFSPILLIILPVYALFQSPQTLLVFQSFILAIAALPLYWIARDKLQNKLFGLAFAIAYLLNPALHGVNTYDFHLEIFTPVFILFAFYYLEKGKWLRAIPFIVLELATLEFAPFMVFSLGFYFFLKKLKEGFSEQQRRLELAKKIMPYIMLMLVSIFSFYLALRVTETINPLKTGGSPGHWGYWGSNFREVATNMIRNPTEAIIFMTTPIEKPYFTLFLFASVLLLPLLAPVELIMALPWLFAALLTDYQPYFQPYYQYSAFVLGQIFIAAICGFRNLFCLEQGRKRPNEERKMILAFIMVSLLLFVTISSVGIPAFTKRCIRPYAVSTLFDLDHVEKVHEAMNLIPANASVATTWDVFPHVCQRLHAYSLKWPMDYPVEYILADVKSLFYTIGVYGRKPYEVVAILMENNEYGVLASLDGVMLLRRGYNGSVKYFASQKDVFNYEQLLHYSGKIVWDYTSASRKVIVSNPNYSLGMKWYGPYTYFSPGNYSATFRIKTANETCRLLLDVSSKYATIPPLAQRNLNGTEFGQMNEWQDFSLHFKIDQPTMLEFRGTCLSNNTQVAIDHVIVEQLGP